MSKYSDLIQATAERMLALMQQGTIPWRRPWNDASARRTAASTGHTTRALAKPIAARTR